MRSTFFSALVLGLLPSLSIALVPIPATFTDPFSLRSATPEQWYVVLDSQDNLAVPGGALYNASFAKISRNSTGVPKFKLTNGELTTADGSRAAFFWNIYPTTPPLTAIPILFGDSNARDVAGTERQPSFSAWPVLDGSSPGILFQLQLDSEGELRR